MPEPKTEQTAARFAVQELRKSLRSQGITGMELARRAGICQSFVAEVLNHANEPRISTLERLANAAGLVLEIRFRRPRRKPSSPSGPETQQSLGA